MRIKERINKDQKSWFFKQILPTSNIRNLYMHNSKENMYMYADFEAFKG